MKVLLPFTAVLAIAMSLPAHSQPMIDADPSSEIVVEGTRLSDTGLTDTALVMVRGRTTRITIELRVDGIFRSYLNGLDSDWGLWRVEGETVCFEGRMRGTFCAPGLVGKRVGDRWEAIGQDGLKYEAGLIARK